jgi:alpha-amylase/alpha-mannosidase (GH57 family)
MKNKYICIHGHFYQPPRENAWLESIEHQESAAPFHDWNERINQECYAPNAAARVLDTEGLIVKIRNNYNRISFNFGPTLLSWLEEHDPETYHLLLKADLRSRELFGGHGNALAQVHGHLIMPLCNHRDKITQVQWGIRDFEHRFGRYPEGMWLAETAVDIESLEVLAAHGIAFTVLAPRQAKALRKLGTDTTWSPVNTDTLDTTRPYWCNLPSGRRIALYFYHGGISQGVAFEGLLNNGKAFAGRLMSGFRDDQSVQLVHIATDGESYGHHHRFGEMALADALNYIEEASPAKLTNYGQFLALFPPEWEIQIHENSSWSCVHGVERWRSNCGCNSGKPGWHQEWRGPLRSTLNWLRDQLTQPFEKEMSNLTQDPWLTRNHYIDVLLNRSDAEIARFIAKTCKRKLSEKEEVHLLRLLEMQRHCILMFTSCGWFFDEISGIETNQILQYALRAMDYAEDIFGIKLHHEFEERLSLAPSNVLKNGAISYLTNVVPTRVSLKNVAMHFAVSSLFEDDPFKIELFNYIVTPSVFEKHEAGQMRMSVGKLIIRSLVTHFERTFSFAVLYLGQHHIIGNIAEDMPNQTFEQMHKQLKLAFISSNLGSMISEMQKFFGPEKFTISSLFYDQKREIIARITEQSLMPAHEALEETYLKNYPIMQALEENKLPLPTSWRNIAAQVLQNRLLKFMRTGGEVKTLVNIEKDAVRWHVKMSMDAETLFVIKERVYRNMTDLLNQDAPLPLLLETIGILQSVKKMGLSLDFGRAQNYFFLMAKPYRKGTKQFELAEYEEAFTQLGDLLKVNHIVTELA